LNKSPSFKTGIFNLCTKPKGEWLKRAKTRFAIPISKLTPTTTDFVPIISGSKS